MEVDNHGTYIMRTRAKEINLDDYLDDNLADRTRDKFMALPDFYKSSDGVKRFTNIEDSADGILQEEWIAIARALREKDLTHAGEILDYALYRICKSQAEEELEEEFEAGKPQADAMADRADYRYQRDRDAEFDGSK